MDRYRARRDQPSHSARRSMSIHRGGTGPSGQYDRKKGRPGRLAQLVISCLLFIALVGAKVVLPNQSGELRQTLQQALHRNMDVEAVFSAVGEAVAGRSQALVQAVFGNETALSEQEPVCLPEEARGESALAELQHFHREAVQKDVAAEVMSLYVPEEVPENVVLEQGMLGFAYAAPVQGVVSSGFGWRTHPSGGGDRFHYGVDLAAEAGSAVTAFADGTVTLVGESTSYGKYCMVSHENGYQTLYAHCRTLTASSGDRVKLGDKLGEVGDTGQATGPHLHFELQKDGTYYNPIYYVR